MSLLRNLIRTRRPVILQFLINSPGSTETTGNFAAKCWGINADNLTVTISGGCRRFSSTKIMQICRNSRLSFALPSCSSDVNFSLSEIQITSLLDSQKRYKKKVASKAIVDEDLEDKKDQEEADELIEEDAGDEIRDWKELKASVHSPRIDGIVKTVLGLGRGKSEESFYAGMWRINGEKVTKKGAEANMDDEIDIIIGFNDKNPEFLDINRIVIDEIGSAAIKSKIIIKVKLWKKLTVENYKGPNKYTLSGN